MEKEIKIMRELKFKFWNKKDKKMTRELELWEIKDLGYLSGNLIPLQFTGLLDKKGIRIYEGDIVKWDSGIGEVYFSNGEFKHTYKEKDGSYRPDKKYWNFVEVIGNIYENPNLLK